MAELKKEVKKKVAKKAPVEKEIKVVEVKRDEAKVEEMKTEKKAETKEAKKETVKAKEKVIVKKKFIPKIKKDKQKKSKEALEVQNALKAKKKHPVFRGRFGKRNIRRKSIAKWDKWRKPRGIDLDRGIEHGFTPKIGYRNKTAIRDFHPSGYREVLVHNVKEIENIDVKTQAIRISATVGKKKRNEIITKANEKKIWVLN